MIKKVIFFVLLFMFIYVSTFNIFMTGIFRIPAPIVFLAPLFIFYRNDNGSFDYGYEAIIFFIASFLYTLIGEQDTTSFFAFIIVISCYIIFFNYVIGNNIKRLKLTIFIFFSLLFLSGLIMLIDHQIDISAIRSFFAGSPIIQSPSGISLTLFNFGYQMAALTSFMFVSTIVFKRNWVLGLVLIVFALCFIFFGMQRSTLVAFVVTSFIFIITYYKAKSFLFFSVIAVLLFIGQNYVDLFSSEKNQKNILNKNVQNTNQNEGRENLIIENLKVIVDYPFGLIFYNKSWNEVVKHNHVYKKGPVIITSHNAYLMFITYLGPLLGLLMLLMLYYKIFQIIWNAFKEIKLLENAMLICLSCSFLAVSINSIFHNEWLLITSGPTHILYFSLLQLSKINKNNLIQIY